METISYKLEHFEGPLDLLLHLIEKNKINIYDIPIVEITAQYLDYVRHMEREDLNIVSEFLVLFDAVSEAAAGEVNPRTSWRASRAFRMQLVRELSRRALKQAIIHAGGAVTC